MFELKRSMLWLASAVTLLVSGKSSAADAEPAVPRFSLQYMDRSVDPGTDFYHYAAGTWLKQNPIPADKSRWGGFSELQQRNWFLLHQILDAATNSPTSNSIVQKVGDFYRSALDTQRREELGLKPLYDDLDRINSLNSSSNLLELLADFHGRGIGAMFSDEVTPDEKNSGVYAYEIGQGGLGLPDRDYYLKDEFAKQRTAYSNHIVKMFQLLGELQADAEIRAARVLDLETELAKISKARVDLRDPIANYHKMTADSVATNYPDFQLNLYLASAGLGAIPDLVVGQPEFLAGLDKLLRERPLDDWKVYLRWHLLHASAPYLNDATETENFAFYGTVLSGQPAMEPRWQRAARVIDGSIGEALGQLYVEKNFPPVARMRMNELVENLKTVFEDRLRKADWMTEGTRAKALAKFARFTQKIGHPDKFRDYSTVVVRPDDYLGNVLRANIFETRRELARVGKPVDRTEWHMTPPTVNAYFNAVQNEIVFPAGILQPPFFDATMDDAVNYGAIGAVIGHEITHGYDDQGRKFDADGNLQDWWTDADAINFEARAQKVVDQYNGYEALPGMHVNGRLTLGENIADLGGLSVAYEAMERALAKNPAKRKNIGGFTPEQRFFLSFAQIWRINIRDADAVRLLTVDVHSPGQFRAIGPSVNMQEFYSAFAIKEGAPMWRPVELRAKIW
ncbi:MAG TPA: M13 family metallopeptidase [Verrucomicrobiae bacterium]|jgi:putative endopeptidase|nr:M13 family metallopeptidase [Verrucomicrobiae bacterium]